MTVKEYHLQTIKGLVRTTVNTTHLDLERRQLIPLGSAINWTGLRGFDNEINTLFNSEASSRRERQAVDNIIVEVRLRAATTYLGLPDQRAFERSLTHGIKIYSRYIKNTAFDPPLGFQGLFQTLEEQFTCGILDPYQRDFEIKQNLIRYRHHRRHIVRIIDQLFEERGADTRTVHRRFSSAVYDCCWCLFNYKKLPLYRTVLRDYLEDVYTEAQRELQRQQVPHEIGPLITNLEAYINQECIYLHFNLENQAAQIIAAVLEKKKLRREAAIRNMNVNDLRTTLNTVLGQEGLDIVRTNNRLTNAITALQNAMPAGAPAPRELSLVKVSDFSGKDNEDPHEWAEQFEQAAAANRWAGNDRLIPIAMGYMKGAALDWARAATAAGAVNRINRLNDVNNPQTSLLPRLINHFAPETKQNQWYQELMTIRQLANESVDAYSHRFSRLLKRVNTNNLVPDQMQVRMYLFGLSSALTPMVATENPANLAAAIARARTVETGYNYAPSGLAAQGTTQNMEVDELTRKIEQLSINLAAIANQPNQRPFKRDGN